jgi:hypothetical protein
MMNQDRGPVEQAAADVSALLADRPGLRTAVDLAERAAADLVAGAQGTRERSSAAGPGVAPPRT